MSEKEKIYTLMEDGSLLSLEDLKNKLLGCFDEEFRPLVQSFLEVFSQPLPTSICPKCKSHVPIWTSYIGFNEYRCQACGNEWEEYTD